MFTALDAGPFPFNLHLYGLSIPTSRTKIPSPKLFSQKPKMSFNAKEMSSNNDSQRECTSYFHAPAERYNEVEEKASSTSS